ncbi:MAG: hypothetical protein HQM06_15970 [Magnetococcales bacterium]|nr:hypothetical protein [Magnetococcales bacterium]
MSDNPGSLTFLDASEDANRVLEIALQNVHGGKNQFLRQGTPNHGSTCEGDMVTFKQALPLTKELMKSAVLFAYEKDRQGVDPNT